MTRCVVDASITDQSQYTVNNSMYLALALREAPALVTAAESLYKAIRAKPLARHVLWVEDGPETASRPGIGHG